MDEFKASNGYIVFGPDLCGGFRVAHTADPDWEYTPHLDSTEVEALFDYFRAKEQP